MRNGLEDCYVVKDNKKLRYGYTTGSCAAAAAKAAAMMLFTGRVVKQVDLMTPKGILLHLEILAVEMQKEYVRCAVRKDGGDDPDATHGMLVFTKVSRIAGSDIEIDGGPGVGRVTRKGLEQPVGAAAINRVPRQMIRAVLAEIREEQEYAGGLRAEISIPGGAEAAAKTFNPRLGIEGGLSILGTSGIVVPMSEEALIASIKLEMQMRYAEGKEYLVITPGNYGSDFIREGLGLDPEYSLKCSNYVGETIDMAVQMGVKGLLFIAHIGKFIKVSGGIMNTHSRNADSRAELLAAAALRSGATAETARAILAAITTEEGVGILQTAGQLTETMQLVAERIQFYMQQRCRGAIQTEVIIFSNQYGYLAETEAAGICLQRYRKGLENIHEVKNSEKRRRKI